MRSRVPKVLHPIAGRPMLVRVLDSLEEAGFVQPTVVVGYGADQVERAVGDRCLLLPQGELGGTGHAMKVAAHSLPEGTSRIVVVHGDEAMLPPDVFGRMLDLQARTDSPVVLLTTRVDDTRGFGRVIRDRAQRPVALLQESELAPDQRAIDEVNLGAYVFDHDFLTSALGRLRPHPPKGEYFLTDVVAMAVEEGRSVDALTIPGGVDVMGINDLVQLEQATGIAYRATNRRHMEAGVSILDSATTFIDEDVRIGPDTVILPFTIISGESEIGRGCTIGPHAHITSSRVGDGCCVRASTLADAVLEDEVTVGPYAHLRDGARIGAGSEIGSYAEIKKSVLGRGSKMHHFGYVGDAQVGAQVNIGAGTVTCNFDGAQKHRTVIGDGAFIGSDTMLRAPVTVGDGAYTGAGSVVLNDVPPQTVVAGVPARVIGETDRTGSDEPDVQEGTDVQ